MTKKIRKSFAKKKRQVAKRSEFLLRHPLIVPSIIFVALFFVGLMLFVALGASTQGAADARIVNVFVDGDQQTVTTRADTIADLMERLEIDLAEEDIVEPERESPIIEDDTQVNVYRARPVKLVDGDRTLTVFTAQQAPRLVALEAGLEIFAEDEITFERLETNVLESSVSEQLSIVRSVPVQLSVYGTVKALRSTAPTVEQLLIEQGVMPEEDDTVQPTADTSLSSGLLIALNRPGVQTLAVSEAIPFDTERIDDDTIQAGRTQVQRAGVAGERAVIYEIEQEDGVETSRREIQTIVVREPVNEVLLRGTKITTPSFNPSVTVAGDKAALMAAAGIAESDYGFVDFIVSHESGWRPGAVNSSSGAYGLCQSLPASKMASAGPDYLTNPVTQLRWCSGYAQGRYGGWSGAYNAWLAQRWW